MVTIVVGSELIAWRWRAKGLKKGMNGCSPSSYQKLSLLFTCQEELVRTMAVSVLLARSHLVCL